MRKTKYTAKQFIEAIRGSGGIISAIADRVGCDWHTAQKYIATYPSVQAAYQDELEIMSDKAVSTVIKAIEEGDVAAAKWWLSCKRKDEFGGVVDITTAGKAIVVNWDA